MTKLAFEEGFLEGFSLLQCSVSDVLLLGQRLLGLWCFIRPFYVYLQSLSDLNQVISRMEMLKILFINNHKTTYPSTDFIFFRIHCYSLRIGDQETLTSPNDGDKSDTSAESFRCRPAVCLAIIFMQAASCAAILCILHERATGPNLT